MYWGVFLTFFYSAFNCKSSSTRCKCYLLFLKCVCLRVWWNKKERKENSTEKKNRFLLLTLLQSLLLHLVSRLVFSSDVFALQLLTYWLVISPGWGSHKRGFGCTECGKRSRGFLPTWQWWRSSRQAPWCESGRWIGLSNAGRRWDDWSYLWWLTLPPLLPIGHGGL